MSTLLLRLAGPVQSWGIDSKFEVRRTENAPSKSGVTGLLAAALGIQRNEDISSLNQLRLGVRTDQEGKLLKDFHTAHSEKNSYITTRYYLSDAIFLVGLECEDKGFLQKLEYALKHPAFPLFLGRYGYRRMKRTEWNVSDRVISDKMTAGKNPDIAREHDAMGEL